MSTELVNNVENNADNNGCNRYHDEKWLALGRPNSMSDRDLFVFNTEKKQLHQISKHDGTADYTARDFDPDSRWLYYTTNDAGEFQRLKRYEMATAKHEEVQMLDWDIVSMSFSHDGRYRFLMYVWSWSTFALLVFPA